MLRHSLLYSQIIISIVWFLRILSFAIVINALLSWFFDPSHPIRGFLMRFIEPIVRPFRALTNKMNTSGIPIDFAPLLAYITISIFINLLIRYA